MAAPIKTFPQAEAIPERSTPLFSVELQDEDGVAVATSSVDDIFLSLRDKTAGGGIVNSRSNVSVKNTNGGTLTTGLFTMRFEEADMQAIGSAPFQPRQITLDFRLTGSGRMTREIVFWLKSMEDIEA
jgi:hypothetical protein